MKTQVCKKNTNKTVTHYNKDGLVIEDITTVEVPVSVQASIFEILNPGKKAS